MASQRWVVVCQDCGKKGISTTTGNGNQPYSSATMSGKCPSAMTQTGNHRPRWERG